ncbi:MAG: nuclear transport factor 2 family protein [Ignavibacteriae bacterium]|nr:nuclear transport factor 2 family protein [Ignavibacteriota bacterium]
MKKYFLLFTLLIISVLLLCQCKTRTEDLKSEAEKVISEYYENLTKFNFPKIQEICSNDFQLVESSGIYTLKEYIGFLEPDKGKLNIEYKLLGLYSTINVKTVWITYKKQTKIIAEEKDMLFESRESALLTKDKDTWKLRLIHTSNVK